MTGLIAKYAMKKVLGKEMEKYKSKDAAGPYVRSLRPRCFLCPELTAYRTRTTR